MNIHGKHAICEIWNADSRRLDDMEYVLTVMRCAAAAANATVRGEAYEKFEPQGLSIVLILAESHLSIHTYPEYGYAAVDCFTCGSHCDPVAACNYLAQALGIETRYNITFLTRPLTFATGDLPCSTSCAHC